MRVASRRVRLARDGTPTNPKVVVSVTSHGQRVTEIGPAIKSILAQSEQADAVVLWLSADDMSALPQSVDRLRPLGLTILECEKDYGAATKLLPALRRWPAATIVTADDDCLYQRGWLQSLITASLKWPNAVVAHRTHQIRTNRSGELLPYRQWNWNRSEAGPAEDHFFTGVGGVLYPPRALHTSVLDEELRTRLSPQNDDIWFNWMARLGGTPVARCPGPHKRYATSRLAGSTGLYLENVNEDGNDRQLAAMEAHFGSLLPPRETP